MEREVKRLEEFRRLRKLPKHPGRKTNVSGQAIEYLYGPMTTKR